MWSGDSNPHSHISCVPVMECEFFTIFVGDAHQDEKRVVGARISVFEMGLVRALAM